MGTGSGSRGPVYAGSGLKTRGDIVVALGKDRRQILLILFSFPERAAHADPQRFQVGIVNGCPLGGVLVDGDRCTGALQRGGAA